MARFSNDVPTQTGPGGERLQNTAVDLDVIAQAHGYLDFAAWAEAEPAQAQQAANQAGVQGPQGSTYNQAALHDDPDWLKQGLLIGGAVGGGALGDYFAAGAGGAGAGASGGGSAVSGGAGAAAADSPYVLGVGTPAVTTGLPAGMTTTGVTTLATPAVATAAQAGTAPSSAPPTAPKPGSTLWGKIAPLLGLGVDAYGAYKGQQATNQATQQLVQSGEQAKADLSKVYGGVTPVLSQVVQRQQANLAPYTSLGSGAASLLGYGLGIPGVQAAPSGVYQPPTDPFGTSPSLRSAPSAPPNSMLAPTFQQGASPFIPAVGQPPVQPFPQPGAEAVPSPTAQPASSLTPQTQTASSYVRMRAPDGEVADVARDRVAFYTAQGAQVVA